MPLFRSIPVQIYMFHQLGSGTSYFDQPSTEDSRTKRNCLDEISLPHSVVVVLLVVIMSGLQGCSDELVNASHSDLSFLHVFISFLVNRFLSIQEHINTHSWESHVNGIVYGGNVVPLRLEQLWAKHMYFACVCQSLWFAFTDLANIELNVRCTLSIWEFETGLNGVH